MGITNYNFAVTGAKDSTGEFIRSNYATAKIVVCGKEYVKLRDQAPIPIAISRQNEGFRRIDLETYASWFKIDTERSGASDLCKVNKYELVNVNGDRLGPDEAYIKIDPTTKRIEIEA